MYNLFWRLDQKRCRSRECQRAKAMSLAALRLSPRWFARPLILGVAVPLTLLAAAGVPSLRYWHARQAAYQSVEHTTPATGGTQRSEEHTAELQSPDHLLCP